MSSHVSDPTGAGFSSLHFLLTLLTAKGVITLVFIGVTALAPSRTEAGRGPLPPGPRNPSPRPHCGPPALSPPGARQTWTPLPDLMGGHLFWLLVMGTSIFWCRGLDSKTISVYSASSSTGRLGGSGKVDRRTTMVRGRRVSVLLPFGLQHDSCVLVLTLNLSHVTSTRHPTCVTPECRDSSPSV